MKDLTSSIIPHLAQTTTSIHYSQLTWRRMEAHISHNKPQANSISQKMEDLYNDLDSWPNNTIAIQITIY